METLSNVKALTFDLFGTVMDIRSSLLSTIDDFLRIQKGNDGFTTERFWELFRSRQRIEQYQDNIYMLGHSGYHEVLRKAFVYTAELVGIKTTHETVRCFMKAWDKLKPFPEVTNALKRLKARYKLIVLSNGELEFLKHLVKNQIVFDFDDIITVDVVGSFKPSPAVYRRAAGILGFQLSQCMMISSNSFDVLGALTCGFRAAFVNRYRLPYEVSSYVPDLIVEDFSELADELT